MGTPRVHKAGRQTEPKPKETTRDLCLGTRFHRVPPQSSRGRLDNVDLRHFIAQAGNPRLQIHEPCLLADPLSDDILVPVQVADSGSSVQKC